MKPSILTFTYREIGQDLRRSLFCYSPITSVHLVYSFILKVNARLLNRLGGLETGDGGDELRRRKSLPSLPYDQKECSSALSRCS